ncbi:MAG: transglycosylase SLT domain-containing protein [Pseudomonadota bacterium]
MAVARFAILLLAVLMAGISSALVAGEDSPAVFPRPPALKPAIAFWTRIYAELDSASGVIHDSRHLDVTYRTLYLNGDAPPTAQSAIIEKTLEDYRLALLALASGKRGGLTVVEEQALRPWGEKAAAEELRAAAERLRFQRGQADRFEQGLVRSRRWKKHIQRIFRERGLPPGLAALPHVESSYNPDARSKVGAAGLWQFMPATARRYLRVDAVADERLDPYKSSEAAAHLLQQNHSVLKSWPLAITAYNHGLSGVRRAVRESGTDDLGEIVKVYEGDRFRFASRNFYAAFLAALDVSTSPGAYFDSPWQRAVEPVTLVTPAYLPADVLVEALGVDKKRLRELNPSLHHGVWNGTRFVPKDHALKLPGTINQAWAEAIFERLAQHFGFSSQVPYAYYEVRLGDSLSRIAESHQTSTRNLLAMNRLQSADEIHAGQVLRVPRGADPEPLGAGAAMLLAAQQATGRVGGGALAVDVPQLVAVAIGRRSPVDGTFRDSTLGGYPADPCREGGPKGATDPESLQAAFPAQDHPVLAADPVDYSVAADRTVEIQIGETLGHYAEWLELSSDHLKELNNLPDKHQALVVGLRLKLEFSKATDKRFEQQRIAYHQALQLDYFRRHRIAGILEHAIVNGDNLWLLVQQYRIPLWLLRQYNPDIDVDTVLPLKSLIYVPVVAALPDPLRCAQEATETGSDRDA